MLCKGLLNVDTHHLGQLLKVHAVQILAYCKFLATVHLERLSCGILQDFSFGPPLSEMGKSPFLCFFGKISQPVAPRQIRSEIGNSRSTVKRWGNHQCFEPVLIMQIQMQIWAVFNTVCCLTVKWIVHLILQIFCLNLECDGLCPWGKSIMFRGFGFCIWKC